MTPNRLDARGHSLLAVFAHPDDESLACGGLVAWCTEVGAKVSLLCFTCGEHGPGDESCDLGTTREAELRAAARALGIADLVLCDYEDGMLPWTDAKRLKQDVLDAIDRFQPDIVITFGEDGLYWHPDHVAVHERTTAAVRALGNKAPALYYVTIPSGRMRAVVNHAAERVGAATKPPSRIFGLADVDAFGTLAATPTLIVDTGVYATHKLAAIKCHVSQLANSALLHVSEHDASRLLGLEHYRRAAVGSQGDAFIERFASAPP